MTRYHTEATNAFAQKLRNILHSRDVASSAALNGSGTPVLTIRDTDGVKYHVIINRARDQRKERE